MSRSLSARAGGITMTEGSLYKNIFLFSVPLIFSQLLQVLFNMADVAVVGKFSSATALGSVGSTSTLVTLFTGFLIGLSNGVNVRVAQYLGAKQEEDTRNCVHTSLILCALSGLVIAVLCFFLAAPMLELLRTKDDLLPGAVLYFRIYALLKLVLPAVSAQAGAMLRTTIAFTTQSGSDAYNVIPQEATLGANMRFIPHQGEQESLAIIQTLAEKHGLSTEVLHANDFTPPVDIHGEAFTLFTRVIGETFPGLAASPYVMTGATDAQFYQPICKSCIRFAPVIYGPEQMRGMHGLNENIEYRCLPGAVRFYQNLIRAEK